MSYLSGTNTKYHGESDDDGDDHADDDEGDEESGTRNRSSPRSITSSRPDVGGRSAPRRP